MSAGMAASLHAFITELDRQTKDIGVFNLGIWGIFFRPLAGGKTIFEHLQSESFLLSHLQEP
jgi:uncharacterized protein YecA (UPF0149 family)